jgi:hypothetical protein
MELIEYGQVRKQEAVKLNVTVCFLDNAVKIYKQLNVASKKNKSELEIGIKSWEHKVDGSVIADEIQDLIEKHIILSEPQAIILTL